MDDAVKKFLSDIGKVGGSSKSDKKLKALKKNRKAWSRIAEQRKKDKDNAKIKP